jgi:hypothetical protein
MWTMRLAAVLVMVSAAAQAEDRFLAKVKLPTNQMLVVAEGDFEARSIGSFSLRLYAPAEAQDETTFFVAGLVRARDGTVEKVLLADIDGDRRQDAVVVMRSAGSGGYLSAQAFAIRKDRLAPIASVDGLAKEADPIAALKRARRPPR